MEDKDRMACCYANTVIVYALFSIITNEFKPLSKTVVGPDQRPNWNTI